MQISSPPVQVIASPVSATPSQILSASTWLWASFYRQDATPVGIGTDSRIAAVLGNCLLLPDSGPVALLLPIGSVIYGVGAAATAIGITVVNVSNLIETIGELNLLKLLVKGGLR